MGLLSAVGGELQVVMADTNPTAQQLPPSQSEPPEDIASLFSWANLHGGKYRDFSASRAQAREEARLRAEEAHAVERQRQEEEAERQRQEEAQIAARLAAEAAEAARQAEADRLAEIARQAEVERQAVLAAQEALRQAQQQRGWQSPPAEVYQGGFGSGAAFGSSGTGYTAPRQEPDRPELVLEAGMRELFNPAVSPIADLSREPVRVVRPSRAVDYASPQYTEAPSYLAHPQERPMSPWQPVERREEREPQEARDQSFRPAWLVPELPAPSASAAPAQPQNSPAPVARPQVQSQVPSQGSGQRYVPMYAQPVGQGFYRGQSAGRELGYDPNVPPSRDPNLEPAPTSSPADDSLSGSRDRVANRWYALKSVFDPQSALAEPVPAAPPARVPVLAVFSLAGGVGKTSLVASLGRTLSARGERVLLVDTAAYGLLPFFFGARDQRPGLLRTFNPPGASAEAPIQLVTLDPESQLGDIQNPDANQGLDANPAIGAHRGQDWLAQEVARFGRGANRVLIDLPTASGATTRRILRLAPVVLVPVAPDMNSVVSVGAIESFFRHNGNVGGQQIMPYYVLNQFDYSLPLHLDVREILRDQIGDRLLPFALRRSPAVSEALAEGMTVMDYAPSAAVAEDYASLAGWVRSLSAPATQSYRGVRWSER